MKKRRELEDYTRSIQERQQIVERMLIDAKELKALLLGAKNDIIATGKSVTYTQTYAVRKDRWTEGQNNTSCMICEKTCH